MSTIQKRISKLNKLPVPNDMTFEDIEAIAKHYNCVVLTGGKHGFKIAYIPWGIIIPIPHHGNNVEEAYIVQLKELFLKIEEASK